MMCINRSVVLVAVLTLAHGVSAVTFSQTAATSAFSVRKYINTVRLNDGKLVVYGGFSTSGADAHQQVYSSIDDGATWTQEAATVAAGDRYGNPLVLVNGNKIVTAGGSASASVYSASTSDLTTWAASTAPSWNRFWSSGLVAPNGKLLMMGGTDSSLNALGDVWEVSTSGLESGTDLGAWTQTTAAAGWERGRMAVVLTSDGTIVLLGGASTSALHNDVWHSSDSGATWTKVVAAATWSARAGHRAAVTPSGNIVLAGGHDSSSYMSDVFLSSDKGLTWEAITGTNMPVRAYFAFVVTPAGKAVVIGGYNGTNDHNDVWTASTACAAGTAGTFKCSTCAAGEYAAANSAKCSPCDSESTSVMGSASCKPIDSDDDNMVLIIVLVAAGVVLILAAVALFVVTTKKKAVAPSGV